MHSIVLTSSDEPKTVLTLEDATNQYANQTVTIDFRNLRGEFLHILLMLKNNVELMSTVFYNLLRILLFDY